MTNFQTESEWNAWVEENAGRFLFFARQQTPSHHDAEDVLQEALIESWRRACGKPEASLVFATIRRRAIDLHRTTQRRLRREETAETPPEFVLPPAPRDEHQLLANAVNALPHPQREVLSLKIWGDLTFQQIAETLEIPQGTAASRYRLALESLRQTLTAIPA